MWPFKKQTPTEFKVGGGWGDAINWFPREQFDEAFNAESTFQVVGWKTHMPRKGDILKGEFIRSTIWFTFMKVSPCLDPSDMFFATVKLFRQELK